MFLQTKSEKKSAAVKRYQVSLSPKKKSQVLVNDSEKHKKQQQSLSPKDKVQILCNDADAHRKQCNSYPPEKKLKLLETNADAHKKKQESLSLEDRDLFEQKILQHNTNIAILSLLFRKLKY
jgi:hypothetical protein